MPHPATENEYPSKLIFRIFWATGRQIGLTQSLNWTGRDNRISAISSSWVFEVGAYLSWGINSETGISRTGSEQLSSSSQSRSVLVSHSPNLTAVLESKIHVHFYATDFCFILNYFCCFYGSQMLSGYVKFYTLLNKKICLQLPLELI